MIKKEDIPAIAVCRICRQPMKVVDVTARAARFGFETRPNSYAIECCGGELTIDDDEGADELVRLLLEYHAEHPDATSK